MLLVGIFSAYLSVFLEGPRNHFAGDGLAREAFFGYLAGVASKGSFCYLEKLGVYRTPSKVSDRPNRWSSEYFGADTRHYIQAVLWCTRSIAPAEWSYGNFLR